MCLSLFQTPMAMQRWTIELAWSEIFMYPQRPHRNAPRHSNNQSLYGTPAVNFEAQSINKKRQQSTKQSTCSFQYSKISKNNSKRQTNKLLGRSLWQLHHWMNKLDDYRDRIYMCGNPSVREGHVVKDKHCPVCVSKEEAAPGTILDKFSLTFNEIHYV